MMDFLKPTRKKVLLSVVFFVIELVLIFGYSLYLSYTGESMAPMCLPNLGGTPPSAYQNPHSLSEAWKLANTPDPCSNPWPGIDSPLVKTIQNTQVIVLYVVLPYLFACIVLSFTNNLKKKNKPYSVTSKK